MPNTYLPDITDTEKNTPWKQGNVITVDNVSTAKTTATKLGSVTTVDNIPDRLATVWKPEITELDSIFVATSEEYGSDPTGPSGILPGTKLILYVIHHWDSGCSVDAAWGVKTTESIPSGGSLRLTTFFRLADGTSQDRTTGFQITSGTVLFDWCLIGFYDVFDDFPAYVWPNYTYTEDNSDYTLENTGITNNVSPNQFVIHFCGKMGIFGDTFLGDPDHTVLHISPSLFYQNSDYYQFIVEVSFEAGVGATGSIDPAKALNDPLTQVVARTMIFPCDSNPL